uniref:Uncharacterized protein n=1 Tax=Romanomermis culicivorax TaxID=13658 RepID=A0A915IXR8_ROMCU
LPLVQCKQRFTANDTQLRKEAKETIQNNVDKYNLLELIYGSFSCQSTYSHRFSASDVAHSITAVLRFRKSAHQNSNILQENFMWALDSLSREHHTHIYEGIELYKLFLKVLMEEVQTLLTTGHVIPSASVLQCVLT